MNKKVKEAYFSPSGTTQKITKMIATEISDSVKAVDLLQKSEIEIKLTKNELLVVGMPVYCGRVPATAVENFKQLKGNNTPAIAVANYGNRDYDDALVELTDLLEKQGFVVIGAAGTVSQHCLFPSVAKSRPDENDQKLIKKFVQGALENLIKHEKGEELRLQIRGNHQYKKFVPVPLYPSTKNKECTKCGVCEKICPTDAIKIARVVTTDKSKCISCTACIDACPQNARGLYGVVPFFAGIGFQQMCRKRKEPDFFV